MLYNISIGTIYILEYGMRSSGHHSKKYERYSDLKDRIDQFDKAKKNHKEYPRYINIYKVSTEELSIDKVRHSKCEL